MGKVQGEHRTPRKQNRTPSLFTIQCRLTVSNQWYLRKFARLFLLVTLYIKGSSTYNSQKCMELGNSRVIREAWGTKIGRGTKVKKKVLRILLRTAVTNVVRDDWSTYDAITTRWTACNGCAVHTFSKAIQRRKPSLQSKLPFHVKPSDRVDTHQRSTLSTTLLLQRSTRCNRIFLGWMLHKPQVHWPLRGLRCLSLNKDTFRTEVLVTLSTFTIPTSREEDQWDWDLQFDFKELPSEGLRAMLSSTLSWCRSTITTNVPRDADSHNLLFAVRSVMHQEQVDLVVGVLRSRSRND